MAGFFDVHMSLTLREAPCGPNVENNTTGYDKATQRP
jgi:hypothetical protein